MKSRDFCYWLQGFFELVEAGVPKGSQIAVTPDQVDTIRKHLAMVFRHEIDPSFGDDQAALDAIHNPPELTPEKIKQVLKDSVDKIGPVPSGIRRAPSDTRYTC